MVLNIILFIIGFILLGVFIPAKLEIKYKTEDQSNKNSLQKEIDKKIRDNYLKIYLFGFIPIIKIKLEVKKNSKMLENKGVVKDIINTIFSLTMEYIGVKKVGSTIISKKDTDKILKSLYFEKLDLKFGFNFYNVILNAYLIAFFNTLICLLIASKQKYFNLNNIKYFTYISNKQIYNLDVFCISKLNFANTIFVIIKVFIKYRKVAKKYGKTKSSDRGFNDDSYDVA